MPILYIIAHVVTIKVTMVYYVIDVDLDLFKVCCRVKPADGFIQKRLYWWSSVHCEKGT